MNGIALCLACEGKGFFVHPDQPRPILCGACRGTGLAAHLIPGWKAVNVRRDRSTRGELEWTYRDDCNFGPAAVDRLAQVVTRPIPGGWSKVVVTGLGERVMTGLLESLLDLSLCLGGSSLGTVNGHLSERCAYWAGVLDWERRNGQWYPYNQPESAMEDRAELAAIRGEQLREVEERGPSDWQDHELEASGISGLRL